MMFLYPDSGGGVEEGVARAAFADALYCGSLGGGLSGCAGREKRAG